MTRSLLATIDTVLQLILYWLGRPGVPAALEPLLPSLLNTAVVHQASTNKHRGSVSCSSIRRQSSTEYELVAHVCQLVSGAAASYDREARALPLCSCRLHFVQ
jgi:hypothetical protein